MSDLMGLSVGKTLLSPFEKAEEERKRKEREAQAKLLQEQISETIPPLATDPNARPGRLGSIFDDLYPGAMKSIGEETKRKIEARTPTAVKEAAKAAEAARAKEFEGVKIDINDYNPFWLWLQSKKAKGELSGLTMYPYGPGDPRATAIAKENLIKQNPNLYKQYLKEKAQIMTPPVSPPDAKKVDMPIQKPPVVAQEVPAKVETPAPEPPLPESIIPETSQISPIAPDLGMPTAPERETPQWLNQLGELQKIGIPILEALQAGLVGYTGGSFEDTATARRIAREDKAKELQMQKDAKEQQERMAQADRDFEERLMKVQQEYDTAMFGAKSQEERAQAIEDRNWKSNEASRDRQAEKEMIQMQMDQKAKQAQQSGNTLQGLIQAIVGGKK